jgi:putative transcriptional regulator
MKGRNHWRLDGEELKEPLHYPECGLDDVYLLNGYERHETPYGSGVAVKSLDKLREAIALHLAARKKTLNGKEIRFLRKQMDLTQSELARLFGVDAQTVARWEKGETAIAGPAELLLRVVFLEHACGEVKVHDLLQKLDETDAEMTDRKVFESTDEGWRPAA